MAATEAVVEEGAVAAIDAPATEVLAERSERNKPPVTARRVAAR